MQEAADSIRHYFSDQGYSEREVFNVEKSFDWQLFQQATSNLSLFSDKKILELRFTSSKLDDAAKKSIHHYIENLNPDFALLITSGKLDSGTLNTQWFKKIEVASALVQIWPVNRDGLATWLEQRLLKENIRADADALALLMDKIEGNLLAAMQEIEKVKLLATREEGETISLDAKTVMQIVADSSRYSVYHLVDAVLSGDIVRAEKILMGLRSEGIFPLLVLNALVREIRSLLPMLEKKQEGQGVNAIMQSARVWYNRKQPVGSALQRLSTADIWALLDHAKRIDQGIKGIGNINPWDELSRLMIKLSGNKALN